MLRLPSSLALVLALVGPPVCEARAQPANTSVTAALDDALRRYADLGRFTGAVLVARGDEVLLSQGYGSANVEHAVPNTPQTRFDIGSLAKQFVAAAVLKLSSEGRLDLHAPIRAYLPSYPRPAADHITLHHLLTHTAGVASLGRRDGITEVEESADPVSRADLLALIGEHPLQFEPGSAFRYSNSGYAVAAAVVEAVAGMPLATALETFVWAPAGMQETGMLDPTTVVAHLASGYTGYPSQLKHARGAHPSWHFGSGGVYSTVGDLFRWHRALSEHAVLPPEQTAAFLAHHVERPGGRPAYGYGWFHYRLHDRRVINHGGTTEGFVCELFRFPEDDLFIVVLANLQPELGINIPDALGSALSGIIFGIDVELPPRTGILDPSRVGRVSGTYVFASGDTVEVFGRDGELRIRTLGAPPWSLDILARRHTLDRSDPRVLRGAQTLEALLTGRGSVFQAALIAERRGQVGTSYASDFAQRLTERHGPFRSLLPFALDANEYEAILQTRAQFERGAIYLHLEMTPAGEAFGWYLDDILPREAPLLPNAGGGFFVDVFPHSSPGAPDALFLSFPDADTLTLTSDRASFHAIRVNPHDEADRSPP